MKLVKEFIFSKAAGLQPLTLRKNNYFSYFSRFKWRTAIFQTPLDVYFWMDNELLNKVQSLASLPTFSCSKSTVEQWNTGTKYELCLKLTIKASERRQYCYLGTDSNVLLVLSLQNWNKYTSMLVQFGYRFWLNSVSFKQNLRYTYLFTEQEEEHHSMLLLLVLLRERIYVVTISLNLICLGDFLNYINVPSCT